MDSVVAERAVAGGFVTRGQEAALAVVVRAVQAAAPPHALLFAGPTGSGKTTLALDLAAGLLCVAPAAERPCRACPACRRVAHGNHPDLHRLAPEGPGRQIRIGRREAPEPGTVRRLLRDVALAPAEGAFRVVVIEEAHRLNADAQNALLKVLEEPPPATCIVLCAENDDGILPTVRSRCVCLRCGPVGADVIAAMLVERGLADPARAAALAAIAGGRPGRAIALAGAPEAVVLRDRLVRQLLDLTAASPGARLTAGGELLSSADELATLLERAPAQSSGLGGSEAASGPARDGDGREAQSAGPNRRTAGGEAAAVAEAPEAPPEAPEPSRPGRMAPAQRRRGLLALGELWRDLARDLAVLLRGGRGAVHQVDLLDELDRTAARLEPDGMAHFLVMLDRMLVLTEQNANPELVLDVLLLGWPRPVARTVVP